MVFSWSLDTVRPFHAHSKPIKWDSTWVPSCTPPVSWSAAVGMAVLHQRIHTVSVLESHRKHRGLCFRKVTLLVRFSPDSITLCNSENSQWAPTFAKVESMWEPLSTDQKIAIGRWPEVSLAVSFSSHSSSSETACSQILWTLILFWQILWRKLSPLSGSSGDQAAIFVYTSLRYFSSLPPPLCGRTAVFSQLISLA